MNNTPIPLIAMNVLMLLLLNWAYFFNWHRLIGWIVSFFSPNKVVKEVEIEKQLHKNTEFKKHLRKWKLYFLFVPVVFVVVFLLLLMFTERPIPSYFVGIVVAAVAFEILSKRERCERKIIAKRVLDSFLS